MFGIYDPVVVKQLSNARVQLGIDQDNTGITEIYLQSVENWLQTNHPGTTQPFPKPPVKFVGIPNPTSGEIERKLDPTGQPVCVAVPLPEAYLPKPKPLPNTPDIGDEFMPDCRLCGPLDTMVYDSVVPLPDGSLWKKTFISHSAFNSDYKWYTRVKKGGN